MSAARILHIPLSGRDRRHYANELRKAENEYRSLIKEAATAHAAAATGTTNFTYGFVWSRSSRTSTKRKRSHMSIISSLNLPSRPK
jgi:hypothetical protein